MSTNDEDKVQSDREEGGEEREKADWDTNNEIGCVTDGEICQRVGEIGKRSETENEGEKEGKLAGIA